MTQVIKYSEGNSAGTFAQLRFSDGKRVLISLTQTELAVFRLLAGIIPVGTIYRADLNSFIERVPPARLLGTSILRALVDALLECDSVGEIVIAIESLSEPTNDAPFEELPAAGQLAAIWMSDVLLQRPDLLADDMLLGGLAYQAALRGVAADLGKAKLTDQLNRQRLESIERKYGYLAKRLLQEHEKAIIIASLQQPNSETGA